MNPFFSFSARKKTFRPHFLFSFRKGNGVEPPKEKRAWGNLPNGFPTPRLTAKGLALGCCGVWKSEMYDRSGRPMVAPTFINGSAIEYVGAGIARPTIPQALHASSLYTREPLSAAAGTGGQGRPPLVTRSKKKDATKVAPFLFGSVGRGSNRALAKRL